MKDTSDSILKQIEANRLSQYLLEQEKLRLSDPERYAHTFYMQMWNIQKLKENQRA